MHTSYTPPRFSFDVVHFQSFVSNSFHLFPQNAKNSLEIGTQTTYCIARRNSLLASRPLSNDTELRCSAVNFAGIHVTVEVLLETRQEIFRLDTVL